MASKKDDRSTLQDLEDKFNSSLEHPAWTNFAENAPKCFRYRQGEQWTASEKKDLEDRGQAPTVENEIKPVIDRIIGQYKKQKTRITYRGRNLGQDEQIANLLTDLALHIHQRSEYEFEEGDCFDDAQVCGFGVLEAKVEFDDSLEAEILIKHEDSLNIFPDPASKRYNWNEDADFVHRAKWISLKKAQAMYPKFKKKINQMFDETMEWDERQEITKDNYIDVKNKRVRIIETYHKKYTLRKLAMTEDPTEVTDMSQSEISKKYGDIDILEKIDVRMQKSIWMFGTLISTGDSPYNHNLFPFVPYFIYRKKNGEPYSMVLMLIDPQDEINKRRSKALHLLNTNQAVAEEGAIRDKAEHRKEMARPDGILEYRRGYQYTIEKNVEVAATQLQFQQESKQAIRRISGVSDEAMGFRSEVRSGIGLQRKQLMTDIIITPIFDNLRRTRMMIGTLIYELIKQYYTKEKIIYVTDELGGNKPIQLSSEAIEGIQSGIYDVIVEEMPDTTTMQDEQLQLLTNASQGMGLPPAINMKLLPMLFQLSQIRGKEDIVKELKAMMEAPPTEQPKVNLSLNWENLQPWEKAPMAQLMGMQELAQLEMQMAQAGQEVAQEEQGG